MPIEHVLALLPTPETIALLRQLGSPLRATVTEPYPLEGCVNRVSCGPLTVELSVCYDDVADLHEIFCIQATPYQEGVPQREVAVLPAFTHIEALFGFSWVLPTPPEVETIGENAMSFYESTRKHVPAGVSSLGLSLSGLMFKNAAGSPLAALVENAVWGVKIEFDKSALQALAQTREVVALEHMESAMDDMQSWLLTQQHDAE